MGFNFCSCVHFAIYATVLSFFISLLNICHVAVLLISLFNAANRQTPHPKRKKLQFSLVCVWSYTLIHTSSKNHFFKFHLPFLSIFLPWFFSHGDVFPILFKSELRIILWLLHICSRHNCFVTGTLMQS